VHEHGQRMLEQWRRVLGSLMCCSAMPFHPAVLILICRKISATFPRMHQRIARHGKHIGFCILS